MTLLSAFLQAFIPQFVAIDPVGLAAIFLGLGQGVEAKQRQLIGRQATLTGGGVALVFLFLGANIFKVIGISVTDFQIAGGLILFVLATRELLHSVTEREKVPPDFGVVPLGMPLIAGPALITTLLLSSQSVGVAITLSALVANLVLVVLAFAFSEQLGRLVGRTGLRAISKIIAMLLAAIAVNMIRQGLKA